MGRGAALGGFRDCALWSPPLARQDCSALNSAPGYAKGTDKAWFFSSLFFLIEHGNLPNCLLNSFTLTTYKLGSLEAFRSVSQCITVKRCQPSVPSKAVPLHSLLSISRPWPSKSTANDCQGASGLCSKEHPGLSLTFTMRKQVGSLREGPRVIPS